MDWRVFQEQQYYRFTRGLDRYLTSEPDDDDENDDEYEEFDEYTWQELDND